MIQIRLFEPDILRYAHLVAESPRQAYYKIRLELHGEKYSVIKESGGKSYVTDRRIWEFDSFKEAEIFFNRIVRKKTDPDRRSPRKYRYRKN